MLPSHGRGIWPRDVLKKVSRGLSRRGITYRKEQVNTVDPVELTRETEDGLFRAAEELGISCRRMPSGAGHDAMCFPEICPAGMVFIPCRGGISHNRKEYTSYKSIADGAAVMYRYLKDKYGTKA